jgi:hypothetical protein
MIIVHDEHRLATEVIRQATKSYGTDENAKQTRGADHTMFRSVSLDSSGSATPVMKTTNPSKNLPAAASAQISHCMPVIGADNSRVPSAHRGTSSMWS